jgi:hypothetical protein
VSAGCPTKTGIAPSNGEKKLLRCDAQMDEETIVAYLDYSRQGRQILYDLRKWREAEEGMARSRSAKMMQLIIT